MYVWDLTANECLYELVPDGKVPIRSITVASDASVVMAANNRGCVRRALAVAAARTAPWRAQLCVLVAPGGKEGLRAAAARGPRRAGAQVRPLPRRQVSAAAARCAPPLSSAARVDRFLATASADKTVKVGLSHAACRRARSSRRSCAVQIWSVDKGFAPVTTLQVCAMRSRSVAACAPLRTFPGRGTGAGCGTARSPLTRPTSSPVRARVRARRAAAAARTRGRSVVGRHGPAVGLGARRLHLRVRGPPEGADVRGPQRQLRLNAQSVCPLLASL